MSVLIVSHSENERRLTLELCAERGARLLGLVAQANGGAAWCDNISQCLSGLRAIFTGSDSPDVTGSCL